MPKWQKCRDAVNGEDAIKARTTTYLPKLSGQDDQDYKDFILRAQFYNATGRTLDGLAGMLGRKPVIIQVPKGLEKYLDNVDGKGHSASQFILMCAKDALTTNWGGVLIDMPPTENVVSQKDFENLGLYAYMTYYKAEDSTNWLWKNQGRMQNLKYVILKEQTLVETGDYRTELKDYYRVLEIDANSNYKETLYNDKREVIEVAEPKNKNGSFKVIPFRFLSKTEEPEEPLLLDLVNVNLSHYRKSADLENGGHLTGVPTPWGQGFQPEIDPKTNKPKPFELGGSRFKYLPSGASLSYLEFGGNGCKLLQDMMNDDEVRMATLGARIIAQQKKGIESAETAKIHNSAENSVLADFANNLSEIFSDLLRIYLEWSSGTDLKPEDVKVTINTDFDIASMSPQELTALVALWQSGGIARSDMQKKLKEGEILDADRNLDEMNAEIEEEQKAKNPVPPPVEDDELPPVNNKEESNEK